MKKKAIKTIETPMFFRSANVVREDIDEEKRTVTLSFSSETPVDQYFGVEILDHSKGAVDMSFLNSGRAPLLKDHNRSNQVGIVESAKIGTDRKGRAVVRFGKSEQADAEFKDVVDGIRTNISVGYRIKKMELVESGDDGDVYRVVSWVPKEISTVAIPADPSVGFGRENNQRKFRTEVVRSEYQKGAITMELSQNDIRDIKALGKMHGFETDADRFVSEGKSLENFRSFVLGALKARNLTPVIDTTSDIGLTLNETRRFSFVKAILAMASKTRSAWDAAAFECEVSRAVADKMNRQPQGIFVPSEVVRHNMARDMNVGVGSQGGYMVQTNLLYNSFIEALENSMVTAHLVPETSILRDLIGDLAIPKETGGATAYWVGEGDDVTESTPALGQVRLSPKTVGAFTDLTRKFIQQASYDPELWIRAHLAHKLAIKGDLAAINGAGTPKEPLGILNTTGIGSVTLNAANTPDWGDVVDLETALSTDNALIGTLGYVTNATICGNMKKTEKASNTARYIMEEGRVNGYPAIMSNQVPEKHIIFANWADLIVGLWGALDLNVDTSTHSKSGGVRVVCLQDMDFAVRNPESFADGYKA